MRKLLLLAWLLYDIVATARFYEYDDTQLKKHSEIDERRNWRKKTLEQNSFDHKDWDERRREYEGGRYTEVDRQMDVERIRDVPVDGPTSLYRRRSPERGVRAKSAEAAYDKETETSKRKSGYSPEKETAKRMLNCDREHERYESCFSGCAAVSCDNPRDRLRPCYPFCEPGCVCIAPYVRDDRTHKCVLPDECSKGLKGIPDLGDLDETRRGAD